MRAFTRRELAFVIIFAASLVWGGWNYRHLFTTRKTDAPPPAAANPAAPTSAPIVAASAVETQVPWGPDPFNRDWRLTRTVVTQSGTFVRKAALKLSAIVVRPQKRYAIINGLIVREGDQIAGRRVTRIESAKVLLDDQGVEVTLTL